MRTKYKVKRPVITQPEDPHIRHIALTKGQIAIVDTSDYGWLMQSNWCAQWNEEIGGYFAQRGVYVDGRRTWLAMHTEISRPPIGKIAIHINKCFLDNRRSNLSTKAHRKTGLPTGVCQKTAGGPYYAYIKISRKSVMLGKCKTAKQAGRLYARALKLRADSSI